jgi:glutathione S-transferase
MRRIYTVDRKLCTSHASGMTPVSNRAEAFTLVGRSSSSFTRVARIFAAEAGVAYGFRIVPDLLSLDARVYGGNPALRLPSLEAPEGVWFGSLNICRRFARGRSLRAVWPEDLTEPLSANAQELTLQTMSNAVTLILTTIAGSPNTVQAEKLRQSLTGSLAWLETHAAVAVATLPATRDVSFLEVTLFCLMAHLEFREVVPLSPYAELGRFRARFAERHSARATEYHFDV